MAPTRLGTVKISLGKFAVLLAAVLLARYGLVLTGIDSFVLRDFNRFGYPLASYLHDSFREGEIPLWNPYNHCGLPFLAQWNTMACYPPSLLCCLFPVYWSLNAFCLLHLYAGGLGMFVLARRWITHEPGAAVAGFAYVFSGILINSLMWPNNIAAFGCLPWVIWSTDRALEGDRRWLATAILIGALQMLTGAPEVILSTWCVIVFVRLAQRLPGSKARIEFMVEAKRLGLIIAGIAAVSLVQLLPFFELLQHSSRDAGTSDDSWSLPAHFWANYLAPLFRTGGTPDGALYLQGQQWTHSHYAGVGVLLLAIYGAVFSRDRRLRSLAVLAVIGMIMGLGKKGLLFSLFDSLGPIALMRFPVKFLILPTVLIPLLAGAGLRFITSKDRPPLRRPTLKIAVIMMAALALIAWMITATTGLYAQRNDLAWRSWTVAIVVSGIVLGWIVYNRPWPVNSNKGFYFLLGALLADLAFHHPTLAPTVARAYWTEPMPVGLDGQAPTLGEGRVAISPGAQFTQLYRTANSFTDNLIGARASLPANVNLITRTPRVEGFYSLQFAEVFEVQKKLYTDVSTLRKPVADFLGVRQVLIETNGFSWQTHPTALPLVTAGQSPMFTALLNVPRMMAADDFDPRRQVFIDEKDSERVAASEQVDAKVSDLVVGHHRISFSVETSKPTLAVIAQAHYPCWKATVDGSDTAILRANGAFQAINVPAGAHRVELRYVDTGFRVGLASSLFALALTVVLGFRRPSRSA